MTEASFLTIDGSRLEYRQLGPEPGHAPTIVMLHDGLGSVSTWRDFPDRVARSTGLGVFVYSRTGYGRSSPCALPRPLRYMHDEALTTLPRILDAIDFQRGLLLGHSDGASIAAIYAGGSRDPRVRGLVMLAPHFFAEDMCIEAIAETKARFETSDLRERLGNHHGDNVDVAFWGWNGAWLDPEFRRWDISDYLADIDVPTLLLQGANDEYGSEKQIAVAREKCGAAVQAAVLPRCGHSPHRDQPDRTLAEISAFSERITRTGEAEQW